MKPKINNSIHLMTNCQDNTSKQASGGRAILDFATATDDERWRWYNRNSIRCAKLQSNTTTHTSTLFLQAGHRFRHPTSSDVALKEWTKPPKPYVKILHRSNNTTGIINCANKHYWCYITHCPFSHLCTRSHSSFIGYNFPGHQKSPRDNLWELPKSDFF